MKLQDKILKQVNEFIKQATSIAPSMSTISSGNFGIMTDEKLDHAKFVQWNTRCLNLLSQLKDGHSIHLEKFLDEENRGYRKRQKSGRTGHYYHSISVEIFHKVAILKALRDDIKSGSFFDETLLVAADTLDSILDQAEYLLSEGYKDPAAVLTGAVLESTLRKLCDKQGISYPKKTKITVLNDLLKDKAYNRIVHKQIIAWADLRNDAAHGHFDKYTKAQVEDMLRWVKDFTGKELS